MVRSIAGAVVIVGAQLWAITVALAQEADVGDERDEEEERAVLPQPGEISEIDIELLLQVPIVEAAAKRRQSLYDAPASVTPFTSDQAVASSPLSIAEALRQVPGAYVMQVNASAYNVGLRGYNSVGSNRLPVMLDGRRTYDASFGYPAWGALPIDVGELESIEVVRGPGSTLYGADALTGVIVLTSRDPLRHRGMEALVSAGLTMLPLPDEDPRKERFSSYTRGYVGGTWNNDARTLGVRASLGFAYSPEWDDRAAPRFVGQYGPGGAHGTLAAAVKLAPDTTLRATGSYAFTEIHEFVTTTSNDRVFSYHDLGGTLRFEKSRLFDAPVSLLMQADITRSRKVSAIQASATELSQDERILTSSHALLQLDASMADGRNVLTIGGETSYSNADFSFVGISPSSFYVAGFLQNETHILKDPGLLLNVGVRVERVQNSDDAVPELRRDAATYTYPSISPRGSLILRPTRGHSLRLSAATGTRLPQIFENFATAQVGMYEPPYFTLVPNPAVEPETVRSIEVGYRGKPFEALRLDAVVFFQQLRDLVAIRRTQIPVSYENAFDLDQLGLELGAQFSVKKRLNGHVSYALTRTLDDESDELTPEHILSVGANVRLGKTTLGADFYFTSAFNPTFVTFLNQRAVQDIERVAPQYNLGARLAHDVSKTVEVFVYGTNLLAMTRDLDDLRQYATDFAYPIGTTVVVGVRLTPETVR